jgi:hypothetical protein
LWPHPEGKAGVLEPLGLRRKFSAQNAADEPGGAIASISDN